jgi:putative transposase
MVVPAMNELAIAISRRLAAGLTTGWENSLLPFRRRERAMLRFRQMKTLQKFASVHANVANQLAWNAI